MDARAVAVEHASAVAVEHASAVVALADAVRSGEGLDAAVERAGLALTALRPWTRVDADRDAGWADATRAALRLHIAGLDALPGEAAAAAVQRRTIERLLAALTAGTRPAPVRTPTTRPPLPSVDDLLAPADAVAPRGRAEPALPYALPNAPAPAGDAGPAATPDAANVAPGGDRDAATAAAPGGDRDAATAAAPGGDRDAATAAAPGGDRDAATAAAPGGDRDAATAAAPGGDRDAATAAAPGGDRDAATDADVDRYAAAVSGIDSTAGMAEQAAAVAAAAMAAARLAWGIGAALDGAEGAVLARVRATVARHARHAGALTAACRVLPPPLGPRLGDLARVTAAAAAHLAADPRLVVADGSATATAGADPAVGHADAGAAFLAVEAALDLARVDLAALGPAAAACAHHLDALLDGVGDTATRERVAVVLAAPLLRLTPDPGDAAADAARHHIRARLAPIVRRRVA